jgi:hypothetical protein
LRDGRTLVDNDDHLMFPRPSVPLESLVNHY